MRDIKFKMWDSQEKSMYQWEDLIYMIDLGRVIDNEYNEYSECVFMQYTGMKDIDGNELYEKDLVLLVSFDENKEFDGIVIFENGCFMVEITVDNQKIKIPLHAIKGDGFIRLKENV